MAEIQSNEDVKDKLITAGSIVSSAAADFKHKA